MADGFIRVPDPIEGARVDNTVLTRDSVPIYRQRVECYTGTPVNLDASARTRVSQINTLFDGKTLRQEDTLIWDTAGTGTRTFEDGSINRLTVTEGQYAIRQGKTYSPYFSGKSQLVEVTFDSFGLQPGVIKRAGYFSSSATAPYSANLDGWFIESNGDENTYYLVLMNNGNVVFKKDWTQWAGYSQIQDVDPDSFNVILSDFLWLGGAVIRWFWKDPSGGFTLLEEYNYAGTKSGVFMRSPNQPVRYEIRSTTGAGTFRTACSQVATEGALSNQSKSLALWHTTLINANAVGTIYAVKGVRKRSDFRDVPVQVHQFGGSMTATSDAGVWMLLLNPTLSAPLVYAQNGPIDEATATTQTVTNTGRTLGVIHVNTAGASVPFADNQLAWMGIDIDDVADQYVLAYMPITANQSINGAISLLVF